MKKLRLMSIVLCVTLILSSFSLGAFALTFDDVDNDPTVSWAKDAITSMTERGYIKGYEDGTFRPYKEISKIECLILMARILNFENPLNAVTVENAKNLYGNMVSKYNTTYTDELCYLLYLGILEEKDLADYTSAVNANTQLLRYQAAILMSKLMAADEDAKIYTVSTPTYADNATIPASARPYVEFVSSQDIMNGMDAETDGKPLFSPLTSLTRAQMATLLSRMIVKLRISGFNGPVSDVDEYSVVVAGETFELHTYGKVYIDGAEGDISEINPGDNVSIITLDSLALVIDVIPEVENTTIYGVVVRKSEAGDGRKITIADYEDKNTNATYTLSNDCKILVNGTTALFGNILADNFVKLELTGSKVSKISTENTKLNISGIIESIDYDNDDHVYITLTDKNGENAQTYATSIKGVKIARDGEDAEFRDLSSGDRADLVLNYGKVTIIKATSNSSSFTGMLTEIIISSSPAVTISANGTIKTYKLRPDVKITVAGVEGDIYNLRPNVSVSGKLDGNEIKSLNASSVAVSEKGEMLGTVVGKNTTYSVITIEDEDGNIQSVYYNSKTNFLNSNGQGSSIKSVEKGSQISVTGVDKNGVFEATIVIIK